jgi:hypothetical protein
VLARGELVPGRIVFLDATGAACLLAGAYEALLEHVTVRGDTTPVYGGHYFVILRVAAGGEVQLTPRFTNPKTTREWVRWTNTGHDKHKGGEESYIDPEQVWTMSGAQLALLVGATGGRYGGYYTRVRGFVDLESALDMQSPKTAPGRT